jgi:UDP-3-O-[3-hydroxymyristoyl] glucosamine N-acyltransferase
MTTFYKIASEINCKATGIDLPIEGIAEPLGSGINETVFIFQKDILKNKNKIGSKAWVISSSLMESELQAYLARTNISYILSKDILDAFAKTLQFLYPEPVLENRRSVHTSAIVDDTAVCSENVQLGPYCTIGAYSRIGKNVTVMANVTIGNYVVIGENTILYPNVSIYDRCVIGRNVVIHSGTVIGSDGFGFYKKDGRYLKIPHVGKIVIEDDVEIGSNCAIDRGTLGETRIKQGTKLDNLIQIAHNVTVGENTLIAAQTGIAGSTAIGDNVTIAGQVGIVGHITIGNNVTIGAQSGVISSIDEGKTVSGYPARDHTESLRKEAYIQKIPEILKILKEKTGE